jgi:hypothetical protein
VTIEEMHDWLEAIEGGEELGAILTAFNLCVCDPKTAEHIADFASVIEPTEQSAFLIAFGHYLAVMAIDRLHALGVPWRKDPAAPAGVQ